MKRYERRPEWNWRNPGFGSPPADDEPVVQVSWLDAVAFCDWLSSVEHRPFRLPTEAEWEYACRAGTETRWSSGDDPASLEPFAWTPRIANGRLHPVGARKPNPFGLFDMHGNVWEWCADEFGEYTAASVVDPKGPPLGEIRVLRGGAFERGSIWHTRSAARRGLQGSLSYPRCGFRVCSPEAP
jgi:formylglycine-generating enzyme required for sulfatase activity